MLTHGDAMHLIANARTLLTPSAGDERLALLPMCHVIERVFGLYLALDARAVSNYLENPDTVMENLQEIQQLCQDALEDAVLMGCDESQFRQVLDGLLQQIENPYRDKAK